MGEPVLSSIPSLVKADVYFHDGLTDYTGYQGSYFFGYDSAKRVRTIKDNFNLLRKTDTIIYQYEYTGSSAFPTKCVFYEKYVVLAGNYAIDTMYYQYDANNRLIKDSVFIDMWGADPFDKQKNVRMYSYPDSNTVIIDWISYADTDRVEYRRDSIKTDVNHNCRYWNIYFYAQGLINQIGGDYTCRALADISSFTTLRNPFSDLNTCGFPGFWMEKKCTQKNPGKSILCCN